MKIQFTHTYEYIISMENLLDAWSEFVAGKRSRKDVQEFERNLMDNILSLYNDLASKVYTHSAYHAFNISDPKPRNIHKASVRDRLLHHALYRILYPFFDRTFVADSYSCRVGRGTHKAMNRFREFGYIVSKNHTRTCWILKCDIKKFFANIDQEILMSLVKQYVPDQDVIRLLENIVASFSSGTAGKGLPLGNLTSQLLVNIYMNEFDQFMKHRLKVKYYIRYADDFVIFSEDKVRLTEQRLYIQKFLQDTLKLELHPEKVFIKTLASGVDFLGWVHFSDHRVLRTVTKRRMMKKLKGNVSPEVTNSYLGVLQHGNGHKIKKQVTF